ncbi:MAG TPA: multidrug effflux MFS transporter [Gammaproteobacteria bacterium]|nr:multidrug effflux MFS transporter [Gammaproteobacteria bacterium]
MSKFADLRLAVVLAFTVALGPFALDAYLPAFPAMADALGVSVSDIGLTLSIYVIALSAGQIVGGPLSDRLGRRQILYPGLLIFIIGSAMVAFSESLLFVLLARAIQGVGGGFCAVSVPAIVRDRVTGNEAARLYSLIALIMFIAPAIAPSLGTLLLHGFGWQGIFVFLIAYGLFVTITLRLTIFRGSPPVRVQGSAPLLRMITNYGRVLRHKAALRFIGLQAMVYSIMLVYLAHASYFYQQWMNLSPSTFALLFGANVVTMAAFSIGNRRLLLRWPVLKVLPVMVCVQASGVLALGLIVWLGAPPVMAVPVFMLMIGAMGGIAPNNLANVMDFFKELSGTAAALMGAVPFAIGGLISAISTRFGADNLIAVTSIMAACALLGVWLAFSARRLVLKNS